MTFNTRSLSLGTITTTFSLAIIIGAVAYTPAANAQDDKFNSNSTTVELKVNNETERSDTTDRRPDDSPKKPDSQDTTVKDRRNAAKEKLSATKLQVCTDRKDKIDKRIMNISERAKRHLEVFDSIAERTRQFYITKGVAIADYDLLAADISSKKAAAQAAVEALSAQTVSIDCEGVEPKSAITTYKETLKSTVLSLKDYRTSIKNLIVAITSSASTPTADSTRPAEDAQ